MDRPGRQADSRAATSRSARRGDAVGDHATISRPGRVGSAASRTAGWASRASSTSPAPTRNPPVLMSPGRRGRDPAHPSPSIVATSPRNQPSGCTGRSPPAGPGTRRTGRPAHSLAHGLTVVRQWRAAENQHPGARRARVAASAATVTRRWARRRYPMAQTRQCRLNVGDRVTIRTHHAGVTSRTSTASCTGVELASSDLARRRLSIIGTGINQPWRSK